MKGHKDGMEFVDGDIVFYTHGKRSGHTDPAIVVNAGEEYTDIGVFCKRGLYIHVEDVPNDELELA